MKKENKILDLFFNEPSKRWGFEEILKKAKISRPQGAMWLSRLAKERVIKKIKERGKMPYYISNYENGSYKIKKRLYALEEFQKHDLLSDLSALESAETVILFGSFSRWDWNKNSDIDLFIYGNPEKFDKTAYEKKLHRQIQIFVCKDKDDLKKFREGFLRNIIEGYLIKGTLDFVRIKNA